MRNIAVIPARGGSKRIKNKNIRKFINKPIIFYVIEILKKSKFFDKIILSTDSKKIAKICKNKVDIIIHRPKNLADDFTSTHSVVKHAINYLKLNDYKFANVLCAYPTSVFLNNDIIKNAFKKLKGKNYIFSAVKYSHPIERSFIKCKNQIKLNFKNQIDTRTQDIRSSFHDAGQFYLANTNVWLKNNEIISNNSSIIEISAKKCHDIDYLEDWKYSEYMWRYLKNE